MFWLEELYLGESVRGREKEIRRKLYANAGQPSIQVLAISRSRFEQLEIIPAPVFMQKSFRRDDLHIFGLAGGKAEAFDLIRGIAEETFEKTGDCDMKAYLTDGRTYRRSRR